VRERRISDDLADAFVAQGVDTLFGLFGDGNLTFMQAMTDRSGVRVVHVRHEAAAVFMASGYARVTGRPGFASVTAGPGLAHTLTPLVSACRARLPLILYAGDTAHTGPYRGGLQEFDHAAFAAQAGALYLRADGSRSVGACVEEAVRSAVDRQIPVLFGVPEDYMEAAGSAIGVSSGADPRRPGPAALRAHLAELADVEPAVSADRAAERIGEALAAAVSPMLVAGSGAVAAGVLPQMRELARRFGATLATTFRAKGCFDDDPASVGIIGPLAHASHQAVQERADLIVGVGANLHGFGAFTDSLLGGKTLCLGTERYGGTPNVHPQDCGVDASLPATLSRLCDQVIAGDARPGRAPQVDTKSAAIESDLREFPEVHETGLLDPRRLMLELDDMLSDDCIVVVGGGHFWSSPLLYLSKRRRDFVFPLEFGSIGMALPTGIGVAASGGRREVVVIEGDGGVASAIQEIETAARHRLRLTVVVMNDGALGAEYHKLVARTLPPEESAYEYVKFDEVARAFGARGVSVRSTAEIAAAYSMEGHPQTVNVIDARISRSVTSRWYRRLYLKTL